MTRDEAINRYEEWMELLKSMSEARKAGRPIMLSDPKRGNEDAEMFMELSDVCKRAMMILKKEATRIPQEVE